jgi:hypothetical protein
MKKIKENTPRTKASEFFFFFYFNVKVVILLYIKQNNEYKFKQNA